MGASGAVLRIPNAPILLSSNKTPTQQSLPPAKGGDFLGCLSDMVAPPRWQKMSKMRTEKQLGNEKAPERNARLSNGLSFRTTEESLRKAFQNFGQLVDVNLVMDKIANRPRGFAFIHYATEEESQKAIEGMHGKKFVAVVYNDQISS
ncbi:hypothetical protein FH972_020683 [Carpinus fangiana]|uniref:RRM domain-containing protein n=1 Tax=Carpinus fangiana TaxID=176857 RepID=A0A5N6RUE2_9ROSI|nr:hypothetical protein FH972_020683 [Carpinus fangiana]